MRRVGTVAIGLGLLLLALEGAYRGYRFVKYGMVDSVNLYSVGYFVSDPTYGYLPAKKFSSAMVPEEIRHSVYGRANHMDTQFTTNSLGYRGKEFTAAKSPGTFRIVTFGGATTMGIEVDDTETWPAVLEVQLSQDPAFLQRHGVQRVEVINAAVHGWRTREHLLRLQTDVQFLEPDLLLLASNWNGPWSGIAGWDPEVAVQVDWDPWWEHLKLFENLRNRYVNYVDGSQATTEQYRARLRREEPWLETFEGNLLKMRATASDIGAQVIIVSLPGLTRTTATIAERTLVVNRTSETPETYLFWAEMKDFIGASFEKLGRERNIPVIDVHERFERFAETERLKLFVTLTHMTTEGHQEIATSIQEDLSQHAGF